MQAVVEEFTPGEAKLVLEDSISPGTAVRVTIDDSAFVGQILYCEKQGQLYDAHVSIDDGDEAGLRRTPRFPVSLPAVVFAPIYADPVPGKILDISGNGIGMELPAAVPVQTPVAVKSDYNISLGIVRFCAAISPARYRTGVELHHIFKRIHPKTKSGLMRKIAGALTSSR